MLKVVWDLKGDRQTFWASSAVGYQFNSFVRAVYELYREGIDSHSHNYGYHKKTKQILPSQDESLKADESRLVSFVDWDGEGPSYSISLSRKVGLYGEPLPENDLIEIEIRSTRNKPVSCTLEGRDLCYATAKACTDAIKKYGVYGYYSSTGGRCNGFGDSFDLNMLLFIKAYALDAMTIRELSEVWKKENSWMSAEATPFEKELELLLFDM